MTRYSKTFPILLITLAMVFCPHGHLIANPPDDIKKLEDLLTQLSSDSSAERQASQLAFEKICLALTAVGRDTERRSASRFIAEKLNTPIDPAAQSIPRNLFLLRQLERIGGPESVPVLSRLLESDDPHVQDGARRALGAIADPSAGAALRATLEATSNAMLRIGIINSLGGRTDPENVPVLEKQLASTNSEVFRACVNSLVTIGTDSAVTAIRLAHRKTEGKNRDCTADALLRHADRLAGSGMEKAAFDVYLEIGNSFEHSPLRLAALRGQLMTAGAKAPDLVLSNLRSDDQQVMQVAIGYVRDMPESGIPELLTALHQLPGESQALLIFAFGNRRTTSAIETVRQYLDYEDPHIRAAALTAIGSIGDAGDAKRLLQVMKTKPDDRSDAVKSLATIRDDRVDLVLIDELANAQTDEDRLAFIGILNQRRSTSAVSEFLKQAISKNNQVRQRAIGALSRLASESDVSELMVVHSATADEERDSVEKAIVSVCQRIPSTDGQADPLLKVFEVADSATRVRILRVLGRIGGKHAQGVIEDSLKSDDADICDAAVVALANWPDGSVAEQLLRVAREGQTEAQRLRALRSLARVCVLPIPERSFQEQLEFLKQAMQLATRKEEINLIIDRAKAVRLVATLEFVAPYLDDPDVRDNAIKTVLALAHHQDLREPNRAEFAPVLQHILQLTEDSKLKERAEQYLQNR